MRRQYQNIFIGLIGFAMVMVGGCANTAELRTPLPLNSPDTHSEDSIGLYIPKQTQAYVYQGSINVHPLSVAFGAALEPNLRAVLDEAFGLVIDLESFPPTESIKHSVSVTIESASVSPGALTFSSSSATVHLKAIIQSQTSPEITARLIEGSSTVSPGALGVVRS